MAQRDIDLVIRAKDQAAKAVKSVTQAVDRLNVATEKAQTASTGTSSALERLGSTIGDLNRQLQNQSAPDRLAQQMTRAEKAAASLRGEASQTQAELSELNRSQERAGRVVDRYASKLSGAQSALERQRQVLDQAKTTQAGYRQALRETERELSKLETKQRNLPAQIEKANAAYQRSVERVEEKAAATGRDGEQTETQRKVYERANATLENRSARLAELRQRQEQTAQSAQELTNRQAEQSAAVDRATADLGRQAAVYDKISANVSELAQRTKTAEQSQDTLALSADKTTARLERQQDAVSKAEVEFQQFSAASREADQQIRAFAAAGVQQLEKALREQGAAVSASRRELAQQEATVREYEQAIAGAAGSTDKLNRSLIEARATARQTRQEVEAQRTTYRQLGRILGETEGDYDSVSRAAERFQQAQAGTGQRVSDLRGGRQLAVDLERVQAAADENRKALAAAQQEGRELGDVFARMGPPTREEAEAMDRVRAATQQARQSFNVNGQTAAQLRTIYQSAANGTLSFAEAQRRAKIATDGLAATSARIQAEFAQTANQSRRAADGIQSTGREARKTESRIESLAQAFNRLFGAQRQSLSVGGRIRAQIVALASAYVGLYGAIEGVRRTVDAYNTEIAAQQRLSVVFKGNQQAVADEMDFLRRTADRLKVSFADLSNQYAQFAIATQNSSLQGDTTRDIFTSVTEAARVFQLDQGQINGVFRALTQIASKGTVQMEELRQQLGDRLPGAVQILADGLGITTAELEDLTKEGKISSAALEDFAEELANRTGAQLPEALQTLNAELGAFQNNLYKAFLRFAKGGFVDSIKNLIREVNEQLESTAGQDFISRLSKAMGALTDVLTYLVERWRGLVVVASAFTGLFLLRFFTRFATLLGTRVGPGLKAATAEMRRLNTASASTSASTGAAGASLGRFGGFAARAAVGVRTLTVAVKALGASTLAGIAITAATTAIGYFMTRASDATETINEHRRIVDELKNAYEGAKGDFDSFRQSIEGISLVKANESLKEQIRLVDEAKDSLTDWWALWQDIVARRDSMDEIEFWAGQDDSTEKANEQIDAIGDLRKALAEGEVSADDFREKLEDMYEAAETPAVEKLIDQALSLGEQLEEAQGRADEMRTVLEALGADAEDVDSIMDDLNNTVDQSAGSFGEGESAAQQFLGTLDEIKKFVPELAAELEHLEEKAKLQGLKDSLDYMGPLTREQMNAVNRADASAAISGPFSKTADAVVSASDSLEATATLLRKLEGYIDTPQWDVNAYRVGYGSDKITLADGTVKDVTQGMRVSREDANRDLYRRIKQDFQPQVVSQIGQGRFDRFTPGQQAVLNSVAYNYGSLPDSVVSAIRSGSEAAIANSIQSLRSSNPDPDIREALETRRARESEIFRRAGSPEQREKQAQRFREEDLDREKEAQKAAEERAKQEERAAEFREGENRDLGAQERELELAKQLTKEQYVQQELAERQRAAEDAGTSLTPEQVQRAQAIAEAEYDKLTAKRQQTAQDERQEEIQQRVSNLEQQRDALKQQLDIYTEQGDQEGMARTREELEQVNQKLREAIQAAIEFNRQMGGEGAAARNASLQTTQLELDRTKTSLGEFGQRANQLMESGLTNAFDSFAKAVANGENAFDAAKNAFLEFASSFLRQIAQMIIQKALFNAIGGGASGGGVGGAIGGVIGKLFHDGGMVGGSGGRSRMVSPAVFANAERFHEGGMPGLRQGEVPAILKEGEEVLEESSPRNAANGGAGNSPVNVKSVNMFDAGSFVSEGLASVEGETSFLNFVSANKEAIKGALG